MRLRALGVCAIVCLASAAVSALAGSRPRHDKRDDIPNRVGRATVRGNRVRAMVRGHYASLPLSFEPNEGQSDAAVKYVSHGPGYTLFLTANQAVLALEQPDEAEHTLEKMDARTRKRFELRRYYRLSPRFHRHGHASTVRVAVEGASSSSRLIAENPQRGRANYFIGKDPEKWLTGVPTYGEVVYSSIYPGVDLVYYGKQGRLEFDFVLAPGADPSSIRLRFQASGPMSVAKDGSLVVATEDGPFKLLRPMVYQVRDGKRIPVDGQFEWRERDKSVGIKVGSYDHNAPLIVDPILSYSTYVGGNGSDYTAGVAVDAQGDAYIAGQTTSTNFPTNNGYAASGNSNGVAFVTELNPSGTAVLYSTYLGGTGGDWGAGMALDPSGNVYITGSTLSTDFPIVNAVQPWLLSSNGNAFVARIDATQSGTASLVYSTYLGGGGNASNSLGEVGLGISADASGLAYVTGQTASDTSVAPFPTTDNAIQSSLASINGNAFFTVLDTTNGGPLSLVYSTYLGGASAGFGDYGMGVAVDGSGDAYLTGQTTSGGSSPFPTTSGAYQTTLNSQNGNVFVTEIATAQGSCQCLVYSTYLGGSSTIVVGDLGSGIGLDPTGKIYVGGDTTSADFPVTSGAYQTTNSPAGKAFIAAFDPTKFGTQSLIYSTYLGGTNGGEGEVINALAVDGSGDAYVAGSTSSSDFPTTAGAEQTTLKNGSWDAFLSEISPNGSGLTYSTYFGGSCANGDLGNGVALDWNGNSYLAGSTCSTDLTVTPSNAYQTALAGSYNAFVAKFAFIANPGIQAVASPTPNSSGWNNAAVTVTFSCIPGGAPIESCPSPVAVSTEGGNQVVTGTAVDSANDSSSASVTVNLDLTPPSLSITSPSNGATVTSTALTVTGTVSDALSGVSSVTCNGVAATIIGTNYSCALTISAAMSSVAVTATDVAGNTATDSITVNLIVAGGSATTGNLNTGRESHTATLLTNGLVLIAGGYDSNYSDLSSAELYNPATQTFSATGNMTTPRANHTATLLNDGTVLITGGYDPNGLPLSSAETYNPATGTFTATGSMSTGRALHTATVLSDGTVLIAGGYDSNYNALASAELYDPATGTFSSVGNLVTGRAYHSATLLNSGKVLLAGGEDTNYDVLASAELYDPTSQTFSSTVVTLNTARDQHTATLLNNGMVLLAGGWDANGGPTASAELYDPNTGTFTATASLATARAIHTATLLVNGAVLIAGGIDGDNDSLSSTEIYDPIAQAFSTSGNLNVARTGQTATVLTSGAVLLAAGYQNSGYFDPVLGSADTYQPTSLVPPNLLSIAISPSGSSIPAATAQPFTATGTFSDNSTEVLSSVIWSSSDNTVATVTNDSTNRGAAYGVASGLATITACAGSICGSASASVGTTAVAITSLSPSAGDVGAPVIIGGTGFGASQGSSTVTFNGTSATVGVWSSTGISATVPSGATSGNVVVTVGGVNSNGLPFTVSSGPVIGALSPTSGVAGAAVTISGANFGATQGSSIVTFNGLAASVTGWSNSSISVAVPSGATTGNIVVAVSGVPSNGVLFTIPFIAAINPSAGPIGTLVKIAGGGFGASQGSGSVNINGTSMQVVSWRDNEILASVASGTTTGAVSVQQGSVAISGSTFTVYASSVPGYLYPVGDMEQTFGYTVAPESVSLLVGQSRTISVTDGNGNPISVQWLTTNPSIVSLSSDNPPLLTGVAPGTTTVYAGAFPVAVTVYSGTSLPTGTVAWSEGGVANGLYAMLPAVPSNTGVDLLVQGGDGATAFSADGSLLWQAGLSGWAIPAFSGNFYVYGVKSCGQYCFTHELYALDPKTHQQNGIYTFSQFPATCVPDVDLSCQDPSQLDNVLYTDSHATEAVVPDTQGDLFVQDTNQVVVFNPQGQQIASVPIETSPLTLDCFPPETGIDCELPNGVWNVNRPAAAGKMIVAGDGNAYVPYIYSPDEQVYGVYASNDGYQLYPTGSPIDTYLVLLRVSPDGSYSKIQLDHETVTVDANGNLQGCFFALQDFVWDDAAYNALYSTPSALSVITNGDQGVAVFSPRPVALGTACNEPGNQAYPMVTYAGSGGITAQVTLPGVNDGLWATFWPALQMADGTYVGTVGNVAETLNDPLRNQSSTTVADIGPGGLVWQQSLSAPVIPLYGTVDGNFTATSTGYSGVPGTFALFMPFYTQLGTLYTLNGSGSIISQTADTGAIPSWTGSVYTATTQALSAMTQPVPDYLPTYAATSGANQSSNGVAIDQVQTNQSQGSVHQVPDSSAAPPCFFTGLPQPESLCSNYNAIELLTSVPPSTIFTNYIETFLGAQPISKNDMAQVPQGTDITGSGQTVTFTMQLPYSIGQGPFSVQIERFDPSANTMSAVTLQGHPIAGWRYWRAYSVGNNDVVVETGAVDTWGPGPKNYWGYWAFRGLQLKFWREYLEYIPFDIKAKGLDPNLAQPLHSTYPVQGEWNPPSPSQGDILYQVCQASTCN